MGVKGVGSLWEVEEERAGSDIPKVAEKPIENTHRNRIRNRGVGNQEHKVQEAGISAPPPPTPLPPVEKDWKGRKSIII